MLKYIILISMILLTGCGLSVSTKPVDKLPLNIEDPAPLKLEPVHFTVITERNADEIFEKMRKSGKVPALFGMTADDYKQLARDIQNIKEYLIKEKLILDEYRKYYEGK